MKNFDPKYNDIPKTEIHIHLEGAIRTQTIIDIAREHNLKLPSYEASELDRHVKIYDQMRDLETVLAAFAIFQNSITSPKVVERIAWELFEDSAKQNIKLLEVRFSPDWAIRHKDEIVGVDLADSERDFPLREFVQPVQKAKDAGLYVTIHTGEDTPASFVKETIELASPHRIGHGIHAIENMEVIELIKERGITLELNPWSNYLTNSVRTIEEHPLKKLFDLGVRVTINSDDPEVLETNLNNEYRIAHEVLGMSMDDITVCNRYAYEASFIPNESKQRIWEKYFQ